MFDRALVTHAPQVVCRLTLASDTYSIGIRLTDPLLAIGLLIHIFSLCSPRHPPQKSERALPIMVKDDACRQKPLRRWFGECAARTCLQVALCDEFSEIIDFPPRGIHRFLELGEVAPCRC